MATTMATQDTEQPREVQNEITYVLVSETGTLTNMAYVLTTQTDQLTGKINNEPDGIKPPPPDDSCEQKD